jgi:hypothetical protein
MDVPGKGRTLRLEFEYRGGGSLQTSAELWTRERRKISKEMAECFERRVKKSKQLRLLGCIYSHLRFSRELLVLVPEGAYSYRPRLAEFLTPKPDPDRKWKWFLKLVERDMQVMRQIIDDLREHSRIRSSSRG